MGTTTLLVLEERLSEQTGDWLEFDTTTNITTNTSIISTTLTNYDGGRDDYFIDWWVYITEGNNITVERQVSDYATATGTLTIRGASLSAETGAVTCRLHRHRRTLYIDALNDAIRETSNSTSRILESRTMVTGNIIPDNSFELWTSSSTMVFFSMSNATAARHTTAGQIRGQLATTSMKVTASADNGYAYISSDQYPRLLDLMNRIVTFKCWVLPEVANDAAIVIYTQQADGTAQTLTSTTTSPALKWTLLELEEQELNDDLINVTFRFKIATDTKYVMFDSSRAIPNLDIFEYLLLSDFADGAVSQVFIQDRGQADDICDDLYPEYWTEVIGWRVLDDGNFKYLILPYTYGSNRQIRIVGHTPLETVSADSDTISLDGDNLNLLIAYAKYKFYQAIEPPVATQDTRRFETNSAKAFNEYRRLFPKLRRAQPSPSMNLRVIK